MIQRSKPIFRAFWVLIIFLLFSVLVFNLRKPQRSSYELGYVPFSETELYPQNFQTNAYLIVTPPSLELDSSFELQVDRIQFVIRPDEKYILPNRICVSRIEVTYPEPYLILEKALEHFRHLYLDETACIDVDINKERTNSPVHYFVLDLKEKLPVEILRIDQHNRFIYPYDDFAIQLYLDIIGDFYYDDNLVTEDNSFGDGFSSNPFLKINIENSNDWIVSGKTSDEVDWDIGYRGSWQQDSNNAPILFFQRSTLTKVITPLLCMVLFVFLISVAINEKKDILIEGGLGIFLGVFSIREILLPGNVEIFTLVDAIIWGIIFTFGVLLLDSLIFDAKDKRSS